MDLPYIVSSEFEYKFRQFIEDNIGVIKSMEVYNF